MNWIKEEIILEGENVVLFPLKEKHFYDIASLSKESMIWEFIPLNMSEESMVIQTLRAALTEKENGNQYPFVIFHKKDNKIIGSTRLMEMQSQHKKLEIGWTWLHPDYWGTKVNPECKLLLLEFCFEQLNVLRVQLKTDEQNIRSRMAIQKIGATFEGTFRNDMIRENGSSRNSAYFSFIDSEWTKCKELLSLMLISAP